MGFVVSLVIFLTSTGVLVNAAVSPTPSAAIAPVSISHSSEGRAALAPLSPEFADKGTVTSIGSAATANNMVSDERINANAHD
ncbi:hypothetical protein [Paraburkholderia jirisanensis]